MKPRIFVGSSAEGLEVAQAVQTNLDHSAEVRLWTQGVFKPGTMNLESLFEVMEWSEFAVFVFSPDDVAKIRGHSLRVVRDNVLFELGLFYGRLGKDRCFFIEPRNQEDYHIATDLLGIVPATYDPPDRQGPLQGPLGAACNLIMERVREQKPPPVLAKADIFGRVGDSPQFPGLLQHATKEVIAIGPSLLYLAHYVDDLVFEKARAGVQFKFLLSVDTGPGCGFDLIYDYASTQPKPEIDSVHKTFRNWLQKAEEQNLDIQIRVAPLVPLGLNIFDADEDDGRILLIPFPYKTSGLQRPCFLFERRNSPEAFSLYYTKTLEFWDAAKPLG